MVEEAERIITRIRQMEYSLDGAKRDSQSDEDGLRVTYPLTKCLKALKEKHAQVSRLHRERFEQVNSKSEPITVHEPGHQADTRTELVQALESYSSHLEPSFIRIELPPTGPNQSLPPTFDLSHSYVDKLDDEFTRVYDEYTRRIGVVQGLAENIISLWAELGTPQAQTDGAIVKYYRDAPEQLGLHEEDLGRLRAKRDKLADEKKNREKRLKELRASVEALWEKLGVDEAERRAFLNGNRGCGVRQINEFEDELSRLTELKRQNLHLFVEDARFKLQELWDALYLSEDEMLEFTPAFSDVYSDALLEAHEREISRLEVLREQRAPTLALVERHRTLVQERDELASSSQDASRLLGRGQKGERRDPGKLLHEEKMRKRIAKELPKVTAELEKALEHWEDEYGRPFLVHGERYLDTLESEGGKAAAPPPRSKTPAPSSSVKKPALPSRANSTITRGTAAPVVPPPRSKTPTTAGGTLRRGAVPPGKETKGSPSRIPARAPLSNLKYGSNSPERQSVRPESRAQQQQFGGSMRLMMGPPLMRAPPPKMRELVPTPELETPANPYRNMGLGSSSIVRPVEPEDVYDDRNISSNSGSSGHNSYRGGHSHSNSQSSRPYAHDAYRTVRGYDVARERFMESYRQTQAAEAQQQQQQHPTRHISNTSSSAASTSTATSGISSGVSGSENWETYDDASDPEPEPDASDAYYAKVRAAAARNKRFTPDDAYATKRIRGFEQQQNIMVDAEGNRIISGSEWTDDDDAI